MQPLRYRSGPTSPAGLEPLERRDLFAVTTNIHNGWLEVHGTNKAETITVDHSGTNTLVNGKKIADSKFNQIWIDAGGGSAGDIVNIRGNRHYTVVDGTETVNAVNLGASGNMQDIKADVDLINVSINADINLDDSADPLGRNVQMFATEAKFNGSGGEGKIVGLAPGTIYYQNLFWGADAVNVRLGLASDKVVVHDTAGFELSGRTAIYTGPTDDTVTVEAMEDGGFLDIHGEGGHDTVTIGKNGVISNNMDYLTVDNRNGFTKLIVDDSKGTTARHFELGTDRVGGFMPDDEFLFFTPGDIEQLIVKSGSAKDTIDIEDTRTTTLGDKTLTRVETGSGDDTVNVWATHRGKLEIDGTRGADKVLLGKNGSTQKITGWVDVRNTGAFSSIAINDYNDTLARVITHDAYAAEAFGRVNGAMPGVLTYGTNDLNLLTINAGKNNDTFVVHSTVGHGNIALNGGAGNDHFNLGNEGSSMDTIYRDVFINGESGTDFVRLNDTGSATYHSYVTFKDHVTRSGGATTWFANVEALDIFKKS